MFIYIIYDTPTLVSVLLFIRVRMGMTEEGWLRASSATSNLRRLINASSLS